MSTPTSSTPWHMGSAGATAFTRGEVARRARTLLEGEDYQTNLKRRLVDGSLPPAVETMLWHYAYGKPAEVIQVRSEEVDLTQVSLDDLMLAVQQQVQSLKEQEQKVAAIEAEYEQVA